MSKKWKPRVNEEYYWINWDSKIMNGIWNNTFYKKVDFYFGNCFKTKKEAEKVLKKIRGIK